MGHVAQCATVPYSATAAAPLPQAPPPQGGGGQGSGPDLSGGEIREVGDEAGVVTIADAASRRLGRIDETSKRMLAAFLRSPRYEVLPTEDVEERVVAGVPREVTVTITASPRRGIEATIGLAERLAGHGFAVVPHLSARLIRDESHLRA